MKGDRGRLGFAIDAAQESQPRVDHRLVLVRVTPRERLLPVIEAFQDQVTETEAECVGMSASDGAVCDTSATIVILRQRLSGRGLEREQGQRRIPRR